MTMKNGASLPHAQRFARLLALTAVLAAGYGAAAPALAAETGTAAVQAREIRLSGDRVTLPFVMVREFPFIEGSVSGVSGKFMLDTGMREALSINSHRIPVRDLKTVDERMFGSGQKYVSKLAPVVHDIRIAGLAYAAATQVDAQDALQLERITPDFLGWVGHDAWEGYTLKLDYRTQQATFYRNAASADYLAGERPIAILPFELRTRPNIPVMPAKVGTLDVTAAFDTGAYGYLYVDTETKERLLAEGTLKPNPGENDYALTGLSLSGVPVPDLASIRIDTTPFPPARQLGLPPTNFLLMGYGFLRYYKTVWDYEGKQLHVLDNR